nr:hypothetical protein [Tanacetum cinerariifolium]
MRCVETIDVATGKKFNMRAMVLWTINDFSARSSLSRQNNLCLPQKILKRPHKWRRLLDFNGKIKNEDPPRKFDWDDIMAQFARLPTCVKGKHPIIPRLVWVAECHVDKDPGVSASSELFTLAYGPTSTPISVNSCVVNGVRFIMHSRDERCTTQNSGICSPGEDEEMYFGQLEEILEFSYMSFKTVLFRVKWFDTSNKGRVKHVVIGNNITQILANGESFKNYQYILATQVKQCFYLEDIARRPLGWKVVEHVNHKKFSNRGVIVVEDDPDIIHVDNSSCLTLTTSLNDLEIAALHIDGQSFDVDTPPDIIDVDEDDDIIDDDVLPHDLTYSDDEDLVNVVDDDGMSADEARDHDGDSGGDDRPPPHQLAGGCRGNGTQKPNLGGRKGMMHTHKETRNLELRKIRDELGPQPIRFEWKDNATMLPLDDHSSHWANLLREIMREFPMHFGSWRSIPPERKAGVIEKIGTQFDLKRHMQSELWLEIKKGIDEHLGKIYTDNKSSLKRDCWGSRSIAALRVKQMQSSATQEYPSLIQTFFDTHTVEGVFLRDEDRRLYMLRLHGLGTYTGDQIMAMVRGGKQDGHILSLSVGWVLTGRGKDVLDVRAMSSDDRMSQKKQQAAPEADWVGPCGPHDVVEKNCRGMNPLLSDIFFPATCRQGILSSETCRWEKRVYVIGDSGGEVPKIVSLWKFHKDQSTTPHIASKTSFIEDKMCMSAIQLYKSLWLEGQGVPPRWEAVMKSSPSENVALLREKSIPSCFIAIVREGAVIDMFSSVFDREDWVSYCPVPCVFEFV